MRTTGDKRFSSLSKAAGSKAFDMLPIHCKQNVRQMAYPFSDPELISARRRSPALRWVYPKCSTILAHWVPFPLPGPPGNHKHQGIRKPVAWTIHIIYNILQQKLGKKCIPKTKTTVGFFSAKLPLTSCNS